MGSSRVVFRPEADPAVLLAWIEDEADLETIHRAARVSSTNMVISVLCVHGSAFQSTNAYSITVSQEFANEFWRAELTQVVYELYCTVLYCTVLYCTVTRWCTSSTPASWSPSRPSTSR